MLRMRELIEDRGILYFVGLGQSLQITCKGLGIAGDVDDMLYMGNQSCRSLIQSGTGRIDQYRGEIITAKIDVS